jgi:hypothetical protein
MKFTSQVSRGTPAPHHIQWPRQEKAGACKATVSKISLSTDKIAAPGGIGPENICPRGSFIFVTKCDYLGPATMF